RMPPPPTRMERLQNALDRVRDCAIKKAQVENLRQSRYESSDDIFPVAQCVSGNWCTHCFGPEPNVCERCKVLSFGRYCGRCLWRIDKYYNVSHWACGDDDCDDPACYNNRIRSPR